VQTTASLEHVEVAIELFRKSTMDAVKSGVVSYNVATDPQVRWRGQTSIRITTRTGRHTWHAWLTSSVKAWMDKGSLEVMHCNAGVV
jgi:hypothetical protein